jgi:hypothetical protein
VPVDLVGHCYAESLAGLSHRCMDGHEIAALAYLCSLACILKLVLYSR